MAQHRSAVKTQKFDLPVAKHFNLPHHSINDLCVIAIDQNETWTDKARKDIGCSTSKPQRHTTWISEMTYQLTEGITLDTAYMDHGD